MRENAYVPLFELTRGDAVESIHYGAVAIVDVDGRLVTHSGNPNTVTYLRSTAKPFQVLPFMESGGAEYYDLVAAEIALMCASHSGTEEHLDTLLSLQKKTGVAETELLCGVHFPFHEATAAGMRQRGEEPTSNRHNCSGKHTGMLAYTRMQKWTTTGYLDPAHPVQQNILRVFSEMCDVTPEQVAIGIDGCSAPNFAVPLANAALAYARLCDPTDLDPNRAQACRKIVAAMTAHPEMVAGPDRFDTRLMEVAGGQLIAKGGAEGYQGIGLLPEVLGPGSPAIGIAIKVADGDLRGRARPAIALEVLRQLGALTPAQLAALEDFGPTLPLLNWRKIAVGEARACVDLAESNDVYGSF